MACEEWEVKDSCAECLRDLCEVFGGGEGDRDSGEGDVLSFLSLHKLVLSAVGDEDHNVRASGLVALGRLASGGGRACGQLVAGFCAENGISEMSVGTVHLYVCTYCMCVCVCVCVLCSVVMSISAALFLQIQLYQMVTELAVSDFSADVRVTAWKSLANWHGEFTQMDVPANTAQGAISSDTTQVGVSSSTTEMAVPGTPPSQKGPPVLSALSEEQNASNMSKALMVSMSDEDHEVQSHTVQAAEQILVVALGQVGNGSTCDFGGTPGDIIERVGTIDFDLFFARRSWEDIHISTAEQINCSSENLLQLLSTGCSTPMLVGFIKLCYYSGPACSSTT